MPDWENLVRARLRNLGLDSQRCEEIVAEVAAHLDDVFSELRHRGIPEAEAIRRALDEIPNWQRLRRQLRRVALKENVMNQRVKSLWVPGLVVLMLSVVIAVFANLVFRNKFPESFLMGASTSIPIDVPWLLTLPLLGALGAFWSRKTGGNFATQLTVCQFPLAATFPIFFVLLPAAYLLIPSMRALKLSFLVGYGLGWVVIPGVVLLFGALPFFKGREQQTLRPI